MSDAEYRPQQRTDLTTRPERHVVEFAVGFSCQKQRFWVQNASGLSMLAAMCVGDGSFAFQRVTFSVDINKT